MAGIFKRALQGARPGKLVRAKRRRPKPANTGLIGSAVRKSGGPGRRPRRALGGLSRGLRESFRRNRR